MKKLMVTLGILSLFAVGAMGAQAAEADGWQGCHGQGCGGYYCQWDGECPNPDCPNPDCPEECDPPRDGTGYQAGRRAGGMGWRQNWDGCWR